MYQPQYQPQSKQELRAWLEQYVGKMNLKERPSRISKGMTIKGSKKYGKYKGEVTGKVIRIHKSDANKGMVTIKLKDENGNFIKDENGKIVILTRVEPKSIIKQRVQRRKKDKRVKTRKDKKSSTKKRSKI